MRTHVIWRTQAVIPYSCSVLRGTHACKRRCMVDAWLMRQMQGVRHTATATATRDVHTRAKERVIEPGRPRLFHHARAGRTMNVLRRTPSQGCDTGLDRWFHTRAVVARHERARLHARATEPTDGQPHARTHTRTARDSRYGTRRSRAERETDA